MNDACQQILPCPRPRLLPRTFHQAPWMHASSSHECEHFHGKQLPAKIRGQLLQRLSLQLTPGSRTRSRNSALAN